MKEETKAALPDGWRWVKLGEVCEVQNGFAFASDFFSKNEGVPLVRVRSVKAQSCDILFNGPYSDDYLIYDGDILIGMDGDFQPCIWRGGLALLNQRVARLRNIVASVSPYYLFSAIQSRLKELEDNAAFTTVKHLSSPQIKSITLALPPLIEQNRVADLLKQQLQAIATAHAVAETQLATLKLLQAALLRSAFPPHNEPTFRPSDLPTFRPSDLLENRQSSGINWTRKKLGEVCSVAKKSVVPNSAEAANLPYIGLEHVESNSGRILLNHDLDEAAEMGQSLTYAFDASHVLYGKLRPYLNKVALPDFKGRCSTELVPLLPSAQLDREYLAYYLRRDAVAAEVMRESTGSRMPRADVGKLLELEIMLLPLAEQRQIVTLLRQKLAAAEDSRMAAAGQLPTLEALPAAILNEVFANAERRASTEESQADKWPQKTLGEVCEVVKMYDPATEPDRAFHYIDISSIDAQTKQITTPKTLLGRYAPSRARQVLKVGDILVSTTRPNLNAVAMVTPAYNNQIASTGFCVLRAKEGVAAEYLFAFVQSSKFVQGLTSLVQGALYPAVTDKQVKAQAIPFPSFEEQMHIALSLQARLAATAAARAAAEAQLASLRQLPAALLRQAFAPVAA